MPPGKINHLVLLTPPGRSALATLCVEGPQAVALVEQFFLPVGSRPLSDREIGSICFGHWSRIGGEEVVLSQHRQDQVEIHCHGGTISVNLLRQSLLDAGCEEIAWQQWIINQQSDPIVSDALIALAEAKSQRTALLLLAQAEGALRDAIENITLLLRQRDLPAACDALDALLIHAPLGQHLVCGWQIVLAGRANVGKSSLINALVGYQRAIVYDEPGTTRDVLIAKTALEGWPITLTDTAGLQPSRDPLELAGMRAAEASLEAADLAILVFDASLPWSTEDDALVERWPAALIVHNKCDLQGAAGFRPEGVQSSAQLAGGVTELCEQIIARLVSRVPEDDAAIPFTDEQVRAASAARRALARSDVSLALDRLSGPPFLIGPAQQDR